MKHRMKALLAIGALGGAGVSAVAVSSGAAGAPTSDQVSKLPAGVKAIVGAPDGFEATLGIDPTRAFRVALPSTPGSAWVTPGSDGAACISLDSGATSCATGEEVADGRLVLIVLPPREDQMAGARVAPADGRGPTMQEAREQAQAGAGSNGLTEGPGTFIGFVDETVTGAELVDADGNVLASSPVADRVYDMHLADASAVTPAVLRLERRGSAEDITLPLS